MAAFAPAVALVLRHEGGFVDDPNDTGGATNRGVTQAVLARWRKVPVSVADVKALSVDEAQAIYKGLYWGAIQGDSIQSQDVANWCLDMAVLRGVGAASKSMQAALGVAQDGAVGSKTLLALNQANPAIFLNLFRSLCIKAFASIVFSRANTLTPATTFLPNWVRRAEEIADLVSLLVQKSAAPAP